MVSASEMDLLVKLVHEALGGDGWAYTNYGGNELVTERDRLEAVVRALAVRRSSDEQAEVVAWRVRNKIWAGTPEEYWSDWRLCTEQAAAIRDDDSQYEVQRLALASPSGVKDGVTEAARAMIHALAADIRDRESRHGTSHHDAQRILELTRPGFVHVPADPPSNASNNPRPTQGDVK